MADKDIQLEIITPTGKVFSGDVDTFIAPGFEGYFGVLQGHAPYVVALKIGEIKLQSDAKLSRFATTGGFAEVLPHKITVLAEAAEPADAIDLERAEKAVSRAQSRIEEGRKKWDVDRAELAMARAFNRMAIAKKNI
ncbi:MAG: F0F1 ATP synthase subunit epsilon [Calditrichaeota bacterium]|nr:MAG: F0F1 ATP synthase subunit epsilon [Calditrichota bacterium]